MLTILLFVGTLLMHANADFDTDVLNEKHGVVSGILSDSVLLRLPPCSFQGQNVSLQYTINNTVDTWTLKNIFTVPPCEKTTGTEGNSLVTRRIGYKVSDLASGTTYRFQFQIGSNKSNTVLATTKAGQHYSGIDTGLPARSGAMVVITVILSVAMFILMVALTVTIVLSNDED
ncbi:uroplakin-2 [Alosa pseudoharengus]|uniref:uroplakin-2 n=1 Tax=Alosa pseudoharengus TaxID=34774 RepID=UPI003F8CE466